MTAYDLLAPPPARQPAFPRARTRSPRIAGALAETLGHLIARARRYSPALPGIAGALAVSWGIGEIAGHVFGHGLSAWVTILAAGVFLLKLDGQITFRGG